MHLTNLNFSYRNRKIFDNFQLKIESESINLFKGGNGAGKTTLLKIVTGLIPVNKRHLIKEPFSYCPDHLNLPNHLYAFEFFSLFEGDYQSLMIRFKLPNIKIGKMSKGMKQKVILIIALMKKANIYLFDEVDANLDKLTLESLKEIIVELKKQGKIIILVSHHYEIFENIADTTWQIN